jgi:hypothetical protein
MNLINLLTPLFFFSCGKIKVLFMNRFLGTSIGTIFALAFFVFVPLFAFAADFSVTPLIIDLKAKPRDILKNTIGVMNGSSHIGSIYAFVNNTDPLLGKEEWKSSAETETSDSLANWIEIKRGTLDIVPNGKVELPLLIQVNLNAKPGMYHAIITFSEGGTRADAEARIKEGISVAVNVEVVDDAKEILELSKFVSNGTFISGKDATFSYDLKNIGNRPIAPKGEVRIFNGNGEEVATINVNEKDEILDPNGSSQLASVWKPGSRFGKYKAMLNIEYGSGRGTLQDTVFFWLVPWKELLIVFMCLLAVFLSFITYWHNGYTLRKQRVLAYAIPHDFRPNAPTVHNEVMMPSVRRVAPRLPSKEEFIQKQERFVESARTVTKPQVQGTALRIQPKKPETVDLRNVHNFTVNLKK